MWSNILSGPKIRSDILISRDRRTTLAETEGEAKSSAELEYRVPTLAEPGGNAMPPEKPACEAMTSVEPVSELTTSVEPELGAPFHGRAWGQSVVLREPRGWIDILSRARMHSKFKGG